jgi:signal peptidase II
MTKSTATKKKLAALAVVLLILCIDQWLKVWVKTTLCPGESIRLADWAYIAFVENKGMAFGMAFGGVVGKYLLTAFRVVLFGVLCWWIAKLLRRGNVPMGVLVGLTLITAGAFGNIVDCLCYGLIFSESTYDTVATLGSYAPFMQGKVVDMFYFPLWTWPSWVPLVGGDIFFEPVFNFADSCVTVGAIYLILFHWKFFAKE